MILLEPWGREVEKSVKDFRVGDETSVRPTSTSSLARGLPAKKTLKSLSSKSREPESQNNIPLHLFRNLFVGHRTNLTNFVRYFLIRPSFLLLVSQRRSDPARSEKLRKRNDAQIRKLVASSCFLGQVRGRG